MNALLVIGLMWAVTYPVRWLGLGLGGLKLPPFWLAFLRFVPVSVFAALVVPDVLGSPEWARRFVACAVGGALMWRSRSLGLGILGGFGAYWAARLAGL
ncbi:AzlD domain-containing protein [Deinococcus koreensis]|uniref:Branched-chain amino acid transport n=1 Tax=Deinococcus koreensis TaxID=2054903 RepID=A0A2K3UUD0_9DEIO|nr:AzlD domain-containing protein [Deinococcus koreensis]PNY80146.1 branched-chain amino acid transport [Deinococcus koreensis]